MSSFRGFHGNIDLVTQSLYFVSAKFCMQVRHKGIVKRKVNVKYMRFCTWSLDLPVTKTKVATTAMMTSQAITEQQNRRPVPPALSQSQPVNGWRPFSTDQSCLSDDCCSSWADSIASRLSAEAATVIGRLKWRVSSSKEIYRRSIRCRFVLSYRDSSTLERP
jgi:hypothetical protein